MIGLIIMPKRGENIYKRKDGRWEGRYIKERTVNGTIHYGYVYAKTYAEIKQHLTTAKNQFTASAGITQTARLPLFSEWFNVWMSRLYPTIKKSTSSKYSYMIEHYISPSLGGICLCDINNSVLNDFVCNKLADGLSRKTVKDIISVTLSALKAAKREGYKVAEFDVLVPKPHAPNIQILSPVERGKLESYIIDNPTPKNMGVLICLFTGIRIGELCALKCGDVCLDEKLLRVNKTLQRIQSNGKATKTEIVIDVPKSECSIRSIPIPECIIPILSKALADFRQDDYVLTGNEKFLEPRSYQYFFQSLLKQCGVEHIKFHALRSTFATRCIEAGFDIKCLSSILGHSSVAITLNTYVFSSMEQKRMNMARLQLA